MRFKVEFTEHHGLPYIHNSLVVAKKGGQGGFLVCFPFVQFGVVIDSADYKKFKRIV